MNKSSDNSNMSLAENNGLNNIERKPISYLTVKDNGKNINIPIYHKPGIYGCECMNCRLANNEISLDFYKGYFLGCYVQEIFDTPEEKEAETEIDDKYAKLFFTDEELANFIMNS